LRRRSLKLVDWLWAIGAGTVVEDEIGFIEPTLDLEVRRASEGAVAVRIYFDLELRPPWRPANAAGRRDVWIDLLLSRNTAAAGAAALEEELRSSPPEPHESPAVDLGDR